jgi:hypothetical protein
MDFDQEALYQPLQREYATKGTISNMRKAGAHGNASKQGDDT